MIMGRLPKIFLILSVILCLQSYTFGFEYESPADNPRLINLSPKQYKSLKVIEKRIYGKSFEEESPIDRIEKLERKIYNGIQNGNISVRLDNLRLESTRFVISGTAMTPMMQSTFNTRYVNAHADVHCYSDVGLIDGLIRLWWPELYAQLLEYRKYKEANFY